MVEYWNKDYSKLVPLDTQLEFEVDMAGMRAIADRIFNADAIRDAVAEDVADKFGKDDA